MGIRVRDWTIQAGACATSKKVKGEALKQAIRSQHGVWTGVVEMKTEAGAKVCEIGVGLAHAESKTTEH